jgi:hypothetical protein
MKRSLTWGVALLGAVLASASAFSQDKDAKKPELDLEAYAKLSQPGPQHKLLEPLVGSWTYKVKLYMDPSQPPMESTGTCERKWIMGGRYVQENYQGDEKVNPFAGQGLVGYDLQQKKYTAAWVDNMSSAIMTSTGTADAAGKTFTYTGECDCPLMKVKFKTRDVLTVESPDRHHSVAFRTGPDGKEMKAMEISFTRVKK